MSAFEQLPPDQRATLSLLLGRGKSYAQVAETLEIPAHAVHDRAHAALAVLAPALARQVDPQLRGRICDYLLGQQPRDDAARTRERLATSAPARDWAKALAAELGAVAADRLPEIPDAPGAPQIADAPDSPAIPDVPAAPQPADAPGRPAISETAGRAPERDGSSSAGERPRVSRAGGLALLGALAVVLIVVLVLVLGGKGGGSNGMRESSQTTGGETGSGGAGNQTPAAEESGAASGEEAAGEESGGTSGEEPGGKESSGSGRPGVEKTIPLTAPGNGKATGGVVFASEHGRHVFLIAAEHLEPPEGFEYVAWLVNSAGESHALGIAQVTSNGKLFAGNPLPSNFASYDKFLLTRNAGGKPTHPGQVVLEGNISVS